MRKMLEELFYGNINPNEKQLFLNLVNAQGCKTKNTAALNYPIGELAYSVVLGSLSARK